MNLAWIMIGCMIPLLLIGGGMILGVKFYGHKCGLAPKDKDEGTVVLSTNMQPYPGNNGAPPVNNTYQTNYGFSS